MFRVLLRNLTPGLEWETLQRTKVSTTATRMLNVIKAFFFFLSKKNETLSIYKSKPKGHSMIPVRFPAAWGEGGPGREQGVLGSKANGGGVSLRKCSYKVLVILLRNQQ